MIKCKSFNVYVNYAGNTMAWNCLLGSVAEFSNEMNYSYCWHIAPISRAFFLFLELHIFLCRYPRLTFSDMPCSLRYLSLMNIDKENAFFKIHEPSFVCFQYSCYVFLWQLGGQWSLRMRYEC